MFALDVTQRACWHVLRPRFAACRSSIDESTYSRDYQQALARTRQAIAVQRAVDYNRVRNTQRAVVELQKALKEHEVCRSPVLPNSAGSEQVRRGCSGPQRSLCWYR